MKNTRVPVTSITVERAEGPCEECVSVTVGSYDEAREVIRRWSRTAPAGGGYDKCDFVVTFADGETYSGRYDMTADLKEGFIEDGIARHLAFYSGRWCPAHLTPERYQAIVKRATLEQVAACANWLDTRDLNSAEAALGVQA